MRNRAVALIETKETDGRMNHVLFNFILIARTEQLSAIRSSSAPKNEDIPVISTL
jgi:hypothetical protein